VYKDSYFAAQCRRADLLRELHPLPAQLERLYAVRQARIFAGVTGIAGFLALVTEILASGERTSVMLVGTWLAMGLAFGVGRVLGGRRLRRALRRILVSSEDPFIDLARLDGGGPLEVAVRRIHRLETASFALPMAAFTLLTPLFVHLVVGAGLLGVGLKNFNAWVLISLLLVGHAHLTLLILSVMHVLRIRSELDRGVSVVGASRGFWALLWTVAASSIPGAVLLCIPPILVALTGLLFVPWMFHWVGTRARQERFLLEDHGLAVA